MECFHFSKQKFPRICPNKVPIAFVVFAPEDDQLRLMLSCWCSFDLLMIFFFASPLYTDTHEHFDSYTPETLFGINLSLFYINIL